jgi:hypothetical protein
MSTYRLTDYTLTKTEKKDCFIFGFDGASRLAHIDDMYITLAQLNAEVASKRDFPKRVNFKSDAQKENEKAAKKEADEANGLLKQKNAKKEKSEIENS